MKNHCELLVYFEKFGILFNMKKECEKFLEQLTEKNIRKFPPFNYYLEIDIINLFDKHPEVGNLLLKEPVKWRNICGDILYSCLNTFECDEKPIKRSQINIVVTFKSLSGSLASPNDRYYGGLVCYQGILLSISKPVNCVVHSVWSCPEDCEDNEIILQYIPKFPPKCHICRSVLFENSGLRRCGEQVDAFFLMRNDLLCRKFKILDYLFDNLILGAKHNLVGITLKNIHLIWSVEAVKPSLATVITKMPAEINKLFISCKGLPWKFIYCLASSIGFNICPLKCFMHLKINLLLSLASIIGNIYTDCSIVHVLAAGYDTGYVEKIMNSAVELAKEAVCFGSTNNTTTALIAGTGGVTLLPLPLHVYNQKQLSLLLSSMEAGEVSTENGKVKLRTAVWAHGMDMKKVVLFNIASVFGSVCRGDMGEYSEEIAEFLLEQAVESQTIEEGKQAMSEIKQYLDAVAGIDVKLRLEAESLLKNYFLAVRKDRPRSVSIGSMNGLISTSLAAARLCQRNIANVDDAVFAIWLHESGSPEPRSAPEEYLQAQSSIKTLDKNMTKFKDWLEEFTGHILDIQKHILDN